MGKEKTGSGGIFWGLFPILGGFTIWGYQIYYWLRYGEWNDFSLL
jgi:hypothetical protein